MTHKPGWRGRHVCCLGGSLATLAVQVARGVLAGIMLLRYPLTVSYPAAKLGLEMTATSVC